MSATVLSDPSGSAEAANETVRCECCGFAEECTQGYIDRVREKYLGRWICGLCAEAVKDEILRSSVSMEEAMDRHVAFCGKFRSAAAAPPPTAEDFMAAVRQLLLRRRGLDSPREMRSMPNSPRNGGGSGRRVALARSGSCTSDFGSLK
ncbi:hypothetical protein QJS04_geneDACA004895 [Acorus gramineus]|uniref:Uncharacterized protein n=1 Tax=Acorus gramineus TaxID=55184 RepID=A0AAV9BUK5_ACOGR|nr:hypothetical protein QJS04_geneDACA004895 [Acorus gramineus]